jgi:hypothetical protein
VPIVFRSGSLNLLEPSGTVQPCNGIDLPYLIKIRPLFPVAMTVTAHFITNLVTGPAPVSDIRVLYGYPRVLYSADTVP